MEKKTWKIDIPEKEEIVLLYTNDLRGNLDNMAYISTAVNNVREKAVAAGRPLLLLDSGNWSQGTVICDEFKGQPMAEIMGHIGYDALGIGEKEIAWGVESLEKNAELIKCPLVCANLLDSKTMRRFGFIQPWIVKEIGKIKVGITGLCPEKDYRDGRLQAKSPIEMLRRAFEEMNEKGVQFIIVLSSMGIEKDRLLAPLFPRISVVVSGGGGPASTEPERVGDCYLLNSGEKGEFLGKFSFRPGTTLTVESSAQEE